MALIRTRPPALLAALSLVPMLVGSAVRAYPAPAMLHAELEASSPAENDTLRAPLDTLRLEFSARVTIDLTRLVLVLPATDSVMLDARSGSDDGTLIVAGLPPLDAGAYVLRWRTTSADGHVLTGAIPFIVAPEAVRPAAAAPDPDTPAATQPAAPPPQDFSAALPPLRALGTGLLLALAGGLLFASRSEAAAAALHPLLTAVALVAPLASFAELVTWTAHVAGTLDLSTVLQLATGKALLARVVLAMLALAVWILARSARAAAALAFLAVLVSGGLGHAGAVSPALAVPLRAVHLCAAAVWLGGLLALARTLRGGPAHLDLLRAVSHAALWSFAVVALTGAAQALLMLGSPAALLQTGYGRLVMGKAAGLLTLAAFGYRHRRIIDSFDTRGAMTLRTSVTIESIVFIGLIFVSAALAFTPLPD